MSYSQNPKESNCKYNKILFNSTRQEVKNTFYDNIFQITLKYHQNISINAIMTQVDTYEKR